MARLGRRTFDDIDDLPDIPHALVLHGQHFVRDSPEAGALPEPLLPPHHDNMYPLDGSVPHTPPELFSALTLPTRSAANHTAWRSSRKRKLRGPIHDCVNTAGRLPRHIEEVELDVVDNSSDSDCDMERRQPKRPRSPTTCAADSLATLNLGQTSLLEDMFRHQRSKYEAPSLDDCDDGQEYDDDAAEEEEKEEEEEEDVTAGIGPAMRACDSGRNQRGAVDDKNDEEAEEEEEDVVEDDEDAIDDDHEHEEGDQEKALQQDDEDEHGHDDDDEEDEENENENEDEDEDEDDDDDDEGQRMRLLIQEHLPHAFEYARMLTLPGLQKDFHHSECYSPHLGKGLTYTEMDKSSGFQVSVKMMTTHDTLVQLSNREKSTRVKWKQPHLLRDGTRIMAELRICVEENDDDVHTHNSRKTKKRKQRRRDVPRVSTELAALAPGGNNSFFLHDLVVKCGDVVSINHPPDAPTVCGFNLDKDLSGRLVKKLCSPIENARSGNPCRHVAYLDFYEIPSTSWLHASKDPSHPTRPTTAVKTECQRIKSMPQTDRSIFGHVKIPSIFQGNSSSARQKKKHVGQGTHTPQSDLRGLRSVGAKIVGKLQRHFFSIDETVTMQDMQRLYRTIQKRLRNLDVSVPSRTLNLSPNQVLDLIYQFLLERLVLVLRTEGGASNIKFEQSPFHPLHLHQIMVECDEVCKSAAQS